MRGQRADESELADFVSARTAELHRAAYLLTADQDRAERLVRVAVDRLRRDRTPLSQAGTAARHHMARLAAAATEPVERVDSDPSSPADRQRVAIAGMSPRQRAVLMLRGLDRLDERATAAELGISPGAVRAAESAGEESLDAPPDSDRCRSALTGFSEQATWPEPATTIAAAAQVVPSRRRSRWRYVAVAVVLAVGAVAPIASQVQHDRWLRTPDGINTSHGTQFHAYTQGFKLVGVQRIPVGSTRTLKFSAGEAIALGCEHLSFKSQSGWPRLKDSDGSQAYPCAKDTAERYFLFGPDGRTSVRVPKAARQAVDVARYAPVPWSRYPVARDHFKVEHDRTFRSLLKQRVVDSEAPVASGPTLTMTGTNGVFTGSIRMPRAVDKSDLYLTGLLSPTSTGQYNVTIDGGPGLFCGPLNDDGTDPWCRLFDRHVPQVPIYNGWSGDDPAADSKTQVVRVEVRDALGPWKLEVRYDRYRPTG